VLGFLVRFNGKTRLPCCQGRDDLKSHGDAGNS
jgi:hypothetical protein